MRRLVLCSLVTCAVALALCPGAVAASSDAREAERRALADPQVQSRLALRPGIDGPYVERVPEGQLATPIGVEAVDQWRVMWKHDGELVLSTVVDLETGLVRPSGQALIVMPDEPAPTFAWSGQWQVWGTWLVVFLACVASGPRGLRHVVAPLALVAAAFCLTIANLVPRDAVLGGNLLLLAASMVALFAGVVIWLRHAHSPARPPSRRTNVRGGTRTWLLVAALGCAFQLVAVVQARAPIDVGYASYFGAMLMRGGTPVYGNMIDLPGIVFNGDTYGPVAYAVYIPGTLLTSDVMDAIAWTNAVAGVIVACLLYLIGRRHGHATLGAWAAATWTTCPFVAVGIAAGNNDVIVALLLVLAMFVLDRPVWRGVLVALAAAAKFTPLLAAAALLRMRGESARTPVAALAAIVGTGLLCFGVALRGLSAFDAFWERAIRYQSTRDPIASLWGLAGMPSARYAMLLAAVGVALWSIRIVLSSDRHAVPAVMSAVLALTFAGLPQFWGVYVTWLVPLVLVSIIWFEARLVGDLDERRASVRRGSAT